VSRWQLSRRHRRRKEKRRQVRNGNDLLLFSTVVMFVVQCSRFSFSRYSFTCCWIPRDLHRCSHETAKEKGKANSNKSESQWADGNYPEGIVDGRRKEVSHEQAKFTKDRWELENGLFLCWNCVCLPILTFVVILRYIDSPVVHSDETKVGAAVDETSPSEPPKKKGRQTRNSQKTTYTIALHENGKWTPFVYWYKTYE
jgi:hypothetical protein